ncbi:MAG: hypothetical protein WCI89_00375 [bacterium]
MNMVKAVRMFLLALIFIGLGLIALQSFWVPKLVAAILAHENAGHAAQVKISTQASTIKNTPAVSSVVTADNSSLKGEYLASDGTGSEITVDFVEGSTVHISGIAFYPYYDENGNQLDTNTGDLNATTTVQNGVAHYVSSKYDFSPAGNEPCVIGFIFRGKKLQVQTDTSWSCGWGMNVNFAGEYLKK